MNWVNLEVRGFLLRKENMLLLLCSSKQICRAYRYRCEEVIFCISLFTASTTYHMCSLVLQVRQIVSDFSVIIAICSMSVLNAVVGLDTPTLDVPTNFKVNFIILSFTRANGNQHAFNLDEKCFFLILVLIIIDLSSDTRYGL